MKCEKGVQENTETHSSEMQARGEVLNKSDWRLLPLCAGTERTLIATQAGENAYGSSRLCLGAQKA